MTAPSPEPNGNADHPDTDRTDSAGRHRHAPLKRHPALQPLSRDHYAGLQCAQRLLEASAAEADAHRRRDAAAGLARAWQQEIAAHFADEERLLPPHMTGDEPERLEREHADLRRRAETARQHAEAGTAPDADWCAATGAALRDHIRWEERTLFPAVQTRAGDAALRALEPEAQRIEASRPRAQCATGRQRQQLNDDDAPRDTPSDTA